MRFAFISIIFCLGCSETSQQGVFILVDTMATDSFVEVGGAVETSNNCTAAESSGDMCWNGIDDDCDGLTDKSGGDPDCAPYCSPSDCKDNDPTTEDFCNPNTWKCENVSCKTDCDDNKPCTKDSCVNGVCLHEVPIPDGCK